MAGSDPRFDPARFETAILFAQRMGAPPAEEKQLVFFGEDTRKFEDAPGESTAWDFRDPGEVTGDAPTGTPALAGVKVTHRLTEVRADETSGGQGTPIALQLTFMPSEWAKVSDFVTVTYGGLEYHRGATEPPEGLFEVAVTTVNVRTREST